MKREEIRVKNSGRDDFSYTANTIGANLSRNVSNVWIECLYVKVAYVLGHTRGTW